MTDEPTPGHDLSGYRQLTQAEKKAICAVKVSEECALRVLDELATSKLNDQRMVALAKTHMQIAFMCAVRAIAQPRRLDGPLHELTASLESLE